jgi:hypothetical protein
VRGLPSSGGTARLEEFEIFGDPLPGFRRHAENRHAGADRFDATGRGVTIKFHSSGQVYLGEDGDVSAVENRGVLQRLVFTFGDGHKHEAEVFTEIIGGRADEIADVFDEEKIEAVEVPTFESGFDHGCFEMAEGAGGDLSHGRAATSEADGVIFRGQITDEGGHAKLRPEERECLLEERRLARAGARDHADNEDASIVKTLTKRAGEKRRDKASAPPRKPPSKDC